MHDRVLTCVYCGHEYPAGTPASGADVSQLTEHVVKCEKHPMRRVCDERDLLRRALVGLVGCDTREELDAQELLIRTATIPAADKVGILDAIDAVRRTIRD